MALRVGDQRVTRKKDNSKRFIAAKQRPFSPRNRLAHLLMTCGLLELVMSSWRRSGGWGSLACKAAEAGKVNHSLASCFVPLEEEQEEIVSNQAGGDNHVAPLLTPFTRWMNSPRPSSLLGLLLGLKGVWSHYVPASIQPPSSPIHRQPCSPYFPSLSVNCQAKFAIGSPLVKDAYP